jgi:phosphoglycolate phosphatase-like HAD superfamily hydrolase
VKRMAATRTRLGDIIAPRAVVLDCDGVLLETTSIKREAFGDLFVEQRSRRDEIVGVFDRSHGLSRFVQFDIVHRDIIGRPLERGEREALGLRYSELVVDAVLDCDIVPGARDLLVALTDEGIPAYVASGSPHAELELALDHHGLRPLLRQSWGHPTTKPQVIDIVVERHGLSSGEVLFIGDAPADLEAARCRSVPFVGRVPRGEPNPFPDDAPTCLDLHSVAAHLLGVHRDA